jgi:hypothetical protein
MKGVSAADIRKLCAEKKKLNQPEVSAQNVTHNDSHMDAFREELQSRIEVFLKQPLLPILVHRYGHLEQCRLAENFVSPWEEKLLIDFINSNPSRWVGVSQSFGFGSRRHQNWGMLYQ